MTDYVLLVSAAVIVASAVILASLLTRYSRLAQEVDRSTRLAKDVWDSTTARFSVVDSRIIDLMARTEVISSRLGGHATAQTAVNAPEKAEPRAMATRIVEEAAHVAQVQHPPFAGEGTETEGKVLRFLEAGPKSSAEIKEQLGRSREHTARLMKSLFDRGLVVRNDRNKPYVYEITESGRSYAAS